MMMMKIQITITRPIFMLGDPYLSGQYIQIAPTLLQIYDNNNNDGDNDYIEGGDDEQEDDVNPEQGLEEEVIADKVVVNKVQDYVGNCVICLVLYIRLNSFGDQAYKIGLGIFNSVPIMRAVSSANPSLFPSIFKAEGNKVVLVF